MTVQLIGSITGKENYQRKFAKAESDLRSLGYQVVNPVQIGEKITARYNGFAKHSDYMKGTIASLCYVDAVCVIDDDKSEGEIIEIEVAKAIGLTFVDYKMVTKKW